MIVVSGGSGRVVQAVAGALAPLPGGKRLGLLKPGAGARLPAEFARQIASLDSPQDRLHRTDGATELVLVPSFDLGTMEHQMSLVAAARAAGIARVHLVSAAGAEVRSPVTLLRWVGLLEREVVASGLPHAIVRCMPHMQTIPLFMRREAAGWRIVGPFRDAKFAWLDAHDAGALIALRIATDARDNLLCELSGPTEASFETVAELLGSELRAPVRYVDVGLPEAAGMLEASGLRPARVRAITEYWDYLASGVLRCGCCGGAEQLLGRPRRTLAEYAHEYAAELRQAA